MWIAYHSSQTHLLMSVRFVAPMSAKMQACAHFLRGRCLYGQQCRNAHEMIVPTSEIREFDDIKPESVIRYFSDK